jgi:hypothetical protein
MTTTIIANYYNSKEFLDLTSSLEDDINVIIYNKSSENLTSLKDNHIVINSENIGREGHTYLTYIIENYEKLSDVNVFIQDDFYNHLFNIDYFKNNFNSNKNNDFYQFPCSWRKGSEAIPFSRTIVDGYLDLGFFKNNDIKKFAELFKVELPHVYTTETCAHFLVSRNRILRHNKEKYKKILEWLLSNEINGYLLEHTWKILFM